MRNVKSFDDMFSALQSGLCGMFVPANHVYLYTHTSLSRAIHEAAGYVHHHVSANDILIVERDGSESNLSEPEPTDDVMMDLEYATDVSSNTESHHIIRTVRIFSGFSIPALIDYL